MTTLSLPAAFFCAFFYPGAGAPTAGTSRPTPKRENGKGNEHQFSFYARRLVTDYESGTKRGRGDQPPVCRNTRVPGGASWVILCGTSCGGQAPDAVGAQSSRVQVFTIEGPNLHLSRCFTEFTS